MDSADIISMIGNLSQSLVQVETLFVGLGFLLGIVLMITGIIKLKNMNGPSGGGMAAPMAFLLGGVALVFLPTMLGALSNTVFGNGNILQYIQYDPYSIYNSMGIMVQTAGLIWFVRGCVLIVHGSEPGEQEAMKGLAFLAGGILAMNFDYAIGFLTYVMNHLLKLTGMVPP